MLNKLEEDKVRQWLFEDIDLKGHRIQNAGPSVNSFDYLTRQELLDTNSIITKLDGSKLINLNASNISSGTLNSARLNITKGTWTPTNAHVTLTVAEAKYWKLDTITFVQFNITWPATADTNVALISGLPTVPVQNNGLAIGYSNEAGAILRYALVQFASGGIQLIKAAGNVTNADMTGAQIIASGFYL